jgi:hypothetical protein
MASVVAEGARRAPRAARSKLYVSLALLITAIVFAGFSPSFYGTFVEGVAHPWIIHVHAAVYVGWLVLLVAQAVLAARGQIAAHRKLGNYGIAYGVLVFVVGMIVAIAMPVINVEAGLWDNARAERFLAVTLGDMTLFGGFFGAAVLNRHRPEIHKRLIVLAAVAVMFAGAGRVDDLAGALFGAEARAFAGSRAMVLALWYAPVIVGMAHDWITRRRIHPVWFIGAVIMAVALMRVPYSYSEQWRAVARAILAPFS